MSDSPSPSHAAPTGTETRLIVCFAAVFPELGEADIRGATQETVEKWDSLAALTLMNVVIEEFGVAIDLEEVAELSSFGAYRDYLGNQG